jgi:hypothetical protein
MTLDTTTGASLIAEQGFQILVQPREAASVVLAAGRRIFDSSEPLYIPTLTGSTDPSWVAENEPIPDSDVTFGESLLMPSNRKSIKALTKFSHEMARQSTVGLDAVPMARVVKDVSDKRKARRPPAEEGRFAQHRDRGFLNQVGVQPATPGRREPGLPPGRPRPGRRRGHPNRWLVHQRTYPLFGKSGHLYQQTPADLTSI